MRLTYKFSQNLIKIFFSAVIIQLFFISLGAEKGDILQYTVISMLEYPAASTVCSIGGGLLLEYILKKSE